MDQCPLWFTEDRQKWVLKAAGTSTECSSYWFCKENARWAHLEYKSYSMSQGSLHVIYPCEHSYLSEPSVSFFGTMPRLLGASPPSLLKAILLSKLQGASSVTDRTRPDALASALCPDQRGWLPYQWNLHSLVLYSTLPGPTSLKPTPTSVSILFSIYISQFLVGYTYGHYTTLKFK